VAPSEASLLTIYTQSGVTDGHRLNFSTALSFALRARGLCSTSSSEGRRAFLVSSRTIGLPSHSHATRSLGQRHDRAQFLNVSFTIRSSSEWKATTQILPPCLRTSRASGRKRSKESISRLTAIRRA